MNRNRRRFVKQTATSAAALTMMPWLTPELMAAKRKVSPNDQISFGVIGCKGMGFSNTRSLLKIPEVQCLALCDVDQNVLQERAGNLKEMGSDDVALYDDYRRMLENKDLDFVVIGTPDHWHCLNLSDALDAGKHVYCEKPLSNTIQECDLMLKADQATDKVVQIGMWQRSGPHWQNAIDFVKSGKLGNIRTVKTWAYQGWMKPVPVLPDTPVPPGVNYDMWLGPAPERPFNKNRFHFDFRWFWDYAGGLMTDWGVHILDFALYGMDAGYPKSVVASGGKFAYPDDASETPDTLQAIFEFDGFTMLWEHATGIDLGPYGRTHGVAFIGNDGTLVVDRNGWEVIPETEPNPESKLIFPQMGVPRKETRNGNDLDRHTVNFIESINGKATPNTPVKEAHRTAVVAHMGNVAYKTGRKIYWDTSTSQFKNDDEANQLTQATYRKPWKLPKY